MRLLTIVHQDDSGPGVFLDAIESAGEQPQTWKPAEVATPPPDPAEYDAILSFGGDAHPVQDAEYPWLVTERRFLARALEQRVPLFGVCLGSQLIAQAAGARVVLASRPEVGWYEAILTPHAAADPLFAPLAQTAPGGRFEALEWHSYAAELPDGATPLAQSEVCLQGYRIGDRVWGIQFHAEVTGPGFQHWVDIDGTRADATQAGLDLTLVARQTQERIGPWNELGYGLCERFLQVVSRL
jgi:GMP synthase (glutamine-hydrolysing)